MPEEKAMEFGHIGYGVKPSQRKKGEAIAYLRSDVTADDLQKITEPTTGEEDWN